MKKLYKQVLTWILCFTLCLGSAVAVHAANESNNLGKTFYVELDSPTITASTQDQTVIMRLKANNPVDVDGMAFTVSQDEALEFTAVSGGTGIGAFAEADVNLETGYAAWGSSDSENVTGVTELAVITFTVLANTPAGSYTVGITDLELTKDYGTVWEETASATTTLTVTEASAAEGYTAGISTENVTVEKGTEVSIQVSADHATDAVFNADEIVVSYDSAKLTFDQTASTLGTAKVDSTTSGKLTITNYGDDRNFGDIYTLVFDTIATGTATVKLDSAGFINKAGASQSDLLAAAINPGTVNLTINEAQFNVTLPEALAGMIEGNTKVEAGSTYEFKVLNTNYTYEFSATMGDQSVAVTSTDGVNFIVDQAINADLAINLVSKTPKSYGVTFDGNGAGDVTAADGFAVGANATYDTDYVFKINAASGYGYQVSMTINGENYTGYTVSTEGNVYTIPGGAITGAVVVTVEKTQGAFTVSVTGDGAGIADGYTTTAEADKAYVLTVVPEAGYLYTVTATMGGNTIELTANEGKTTYTTPAVTGDLVFKIDRTVDTSDVAVSDKVNVNNETVFAVRYKTKLADNKVPTYNGNAMYWSENHQEYIYLTIAGTLSEDEAKAVIGIADGTPVTVADSSDVNGSGKLDASDAQYVWNMYNAQYSAFTEDVTMIDFIKADRNADYKIDTEDAAYIVNEILGAATN